MSNYQTGRTCRWSRNRFVFENKQNMCTKRTAARAARDPFTDDRTDATVGTVTTVAWPDPRFDFVTGLRISWIRTGNAKNRKFLRFLAAADNGAAESGTVLAGRVRLLAGTPQKRIHTVLAACVRVSHALRVYILYSTPSDETAHGHGVFLVRLLFRRDYRTRFGAGAERVVLRPNGRRTGEARCRKRTGRKIVIVDNICFTVLLLL